MAYSIDLRKKVIEYLASGHSQREAREVFNISLAAINRWHQLYIQTGKLEDKKPCRSFKKLDPVKLQAYVQEHPDAYLKEIGEVFGCTGSSVRKAFRRLGITRKKRRSDTGSKSLSK
jgi:Transposase and inactivated derivatives